MGYFLASFSCSAVHDLTFSVDTKTAMMVILMGGETYDDYIDFLFSSSR